jgi:hypothetical protein
LWSISLTRAVIWPHSKSVGVIARIRLNLLLTR